MFFKKLKNVLIFFSFFTFINPFLCYAIDTESQNLIDENPENIQILYFNNKDENLLNDLKNKNKILKNNDDNTKYPIEEIHICFKTTINYQNYNVLKNNSSKRINELLKSIEGLIQLSSKESIKLVIYNLTHENLGLDFIERVAYHISPNNFEEFEYSAQDGNCEILYYPIQTDLEKQKEDSKKYELLKNNLNKLKIIVKGELNPDTIRSIENINKKIPEINQIEIHADK